MLCADWWLLYGSRPVPSIASHNRQPALSPTLASETHQDFSRRRATKAFPDSYALLRCQARSSLPSQAQCVSSRLLQQHELNQRRRVPDTGSFSSTSAPSHSGTFRGVWQSGSSSKPPHTHVSTGLLQQSRATHHEGQLRGTGTLVGSNPGLPRWPGRGPRTIPVRPRATARFSWWGRDSRPERGDDGDSKGEIPRENALGMAGVGPEAASTPAKMAALASTSSVDPVTGEMLCIWNLSQLFAPGFAFQLAPYQRPYDWEEGNCEALFNDLLARIQDCEDDTDISSLRPYHMDRILIESAPSSASKFLVADGKNRLVTICLLLAAVQARLGGALEQDDFAAEISKYILFEAPSNKEKPSAKTPPGTLMPRVSFQRSGDTKFLAEVLKDPVKFSNPRDKPTDLEDKQISRKNIFKNFQAFCKELSDLEIGECKRLAEFLLSKARFAVHFCSRDVALELYLRQRSRGRDHTLMDLVKATVLALTGEEEQDELSRKWEDMTERLNMYEGKKGGDTRDGTLDVLKVLHCILTRKPVYPKGTEEVKLINLITNYKVSRPADGEKLAQDGGDDGQRENTGLPFFEELLEPYVNAYMNLRERTFSCPDKDHEHEILYYLTVLNRILVVSGEGWWMPPALWALKELRGDSARVLEALKDLEALSMFLLLSYRSPGKKCWERCIEVVEQLKRGERQPLTSSERAAFLELLERPQDLADTKAVEPTRAKLLLLRLNEYKLFSTGQYAHVRAYEDTSELSVEHVLPLTLDPKTDYAIWFKDPAAHSLYKKKLGNLVVLSLRKNIKLKNSGHENKMRLYADNLGGRSSFLPLTDELAEEYRKKWGKEEVEKQTQHLIETCADCYNLR